MCCNIEMFQRVLLQIRKTSTVKLDTGVILGVVASCHIC